MRIVIALLLIHSLALAATPDPFANHDRVAWTKALENWTNVVVGYRASAIAARGEPAAVARLWAHAGELREMLRRCDGNADAESIRIAKLALQEADTYLDQRFTSRPTSPPAGRRR